jgi:hypothetical protein
MSLGTSCHTKLNDLFCMQVLMVALKFLHSSATAARIAEVMFLGGGS